MRCTLHRHNQTTYLLASILNRVPRRKLDIQRPEMFGIEQETSALLLGMHIGTGISREKKRRAVIEKRANSRRSRMAAPINRELTLDGVHFTSVTPREPSTAFIKMRFIPLNMHRADIVTFPKWLISPAVSGHREPISSRGSS